MPWGAAEEGAAASSRTPSHWEEEGRQWASGQHGSGAFR